MDEKVHVYAEQISYVRLTDARTVNIVLTKLHWGLSIAAWSPIHVCRYSSGIERRGMGGWGFTIVLGSYRILSSREAPPHIFLLD